MITTLILIRVIYVCNFSRLTFPLQQHIAEFLLFSIVLDEQIRVERASTDLNLTFRCSDDSNIKDSATFTRTFSSLNAHCSSYYEAILLQ